MTNLSLYTVSALLILDTDGQRVLAKYYAPPHHEAGSTGAGVAADLGVGAGGPGMPGLATLKEQKTFEKGLMDKIRRGGGESWYPALLAGVPFKQLRQGTEGGCGSLSTCGLRAEVASRRVQTCVTTEKGLRYGVWKQCGRNPNEKML